MHHLMNPSGDTSAHLIHNCQIQQSSTCVSILFNNNFKFKVLRQENKDTDGNLHVLALDQII